MKLLNGRELADYIKERQAHQVRELRQAHGITPKLAIVLTVDNPIINTYVRLKRQYGDDILVDVAVHEVTMTELRQTLEELNNDETIHGIIVQLPLADETQTETIVNLVDPAKDVDALGVRPAFEPATPMAIQWLLAGYNIDLPGKRIVLVGRGKLVGAPLEKLLLDLGMDVTVVDKNHGDVATALPNADIIVTATGNPALIHADMIKQGAVIIDAGVASEDGKTVGDLAPDVYERADLTLTPQKGGVGPLTVSALFDNVIRAAQRQAEADKQ